MKEILMYNERSSSHVCVYGFTLFFDSKHYVVNNCAIEVDPAYFLFRFEKDTTYNCECVRLPFVST